MTDIYDLRGLNCPLPVLKTKRRMQDMTTGDQLWIETTDPLAVIDVANFCQMEGHALIESISVDGGHRFLIRRG